MKRLSRLDFLAPPGRPWLGYLILALAGASLLTLGALLWLTRARGDQPRSAPASPSSLRAPLAQAGEPGVAGLRSPSDAYADAGMLHERFQLRQARVLGQAAALPWGEIVNAAIGHLPPGVTLVRLEPDTAGPGNALLLRLGARALDSARMRNFVDALGSDTRLASVTLLAPVVADADPSAAQPQAVRFSVMVGWRDITAQTLAGNAATAAPGMAPVAPVPRVETARPADAPAVPPVPATVPDRKP